MNPIIKIGDTTEIDLRQISRVMPLNTRVNPVRYTVHFIGSDNTLEIWEETDMHREEFIRFWKECVAQEPMKTRKEPEYRRIDPEKSE